MFYQLYVIHALYKGAMLPVVWALLGSKTTGRKLEGKSYEVYEKLLAILKREACNLGYRLSPDLVMIDFELSAKKAYEFHFPQVKVLGCFFHFGKALLAYLKDDCKLSIQYREDECLKSWLKSVNALSLLPPNKIETAWIHLDDNRPDHESIGTFCDYFVSTWLDDGALFPISLWCQWDNEIRTNNHIEGFLILM